ncbi:DCL family protein [Micrococcus luteus]|uniref:DCL family protein n=1 Tax=Micrococcus luteus TaxID=1270 RepID=UPI0021B176B1|nr:DCL family protein [Micrococcus luteus]
MTVAYTLGDQTFATKKAVLAHASEVLNRISLGEVLHGQVERFALDLLTHHPEAEQKHGAGIAGVAVVLMPEWGTRNFFVFRVDASIDNWSVKKCVANMRPDTARRHP